MAYTDISLAELRSKLGIEVNSRGYADCVFCGGKKKLHFKDDEGFWRCPVCRSSGRTLHLYARYQLGMETLPDDKKERAKLSKQLSEFMGYTDPEIRKNRPAPPPKAPKQPVASDEQLHTVYSALASLAEFRLTAEHKQALKKRGLTGSIIERNGYRTYPTKTRVPAQIVNLYNQVDPALRAGLSSKKAAQIQFGLHVAQELELRGHNLEGIPGFYKFGPHWCLSYHPGIMIPTRNIHGQIVIWQVRKDYGDTKYITLSCADMPGAVTDNVSRCHFPIGNAKLDTPGVKVIFTEGPLKADVALALTKDPCIFAAIPGVSNTKDLLRNCKALTDAGITTMFNALDMDRYTNHNVREPAADLCAAIGKRGIQVIPMCWGEQYAVKTLDAYASIAKLRGVQVPPIDYRATVFEKLDNVSASLHKAGIEYGKDLPKAIRHWEPQTKGIDDYLYSKIQRKEHTQKEKANHLHLYHATLLRINED